MRMVDLIIKKQEKKELSKEEIDFMIEGFTVGDIPDYQMSAFAMAVYFQGMTDHERMLFTNARCPNCHKKLELKGEGEGKIFVCKCGFREKLSAFNKRKENEKASISNKEASKYMVKQNRKQDESINTALADALKKLKL